MKKQIKQLLEEVAEIEGDKYAFISYHTDGTVILNVRNQQILIADDEDSMIRQLKNHIK